MSEFGELMGQVSGPEHRFGHRQHVQLTWLAVRRYGTATAITLVSDGIQQTARYAWAPQKYHATVSRAWVELVGHQARGAIANRHARLHQPVGDAAERAIDHDQPTPVRQAHSVQRGEGDQSAQAVAENGDMVDVTGALERDDNVAERAHARL